MTQVSFLRRHSQDVDTINIPSFRFAYQSVDAVLKDDILNREQKRAILSSWASDLFAVEACPWLRRVPGVSQDLQIGEIFKGLRSLDDDLPPRGGAHGKLARIFRRPLVTANRRRCRDPMTCAPWPSTGGRRGTHRN